MNTYKKILFLLLTIIPVSSSLHGTTAGVEALKTDLLGPSVAPSDDPRVIALAVAGICVTFFGGLITYNTLCNRATALENWKSDLRKILAFLVGSSCMVGGVASVIASKSIISGMDALSIQWFKENYVENKPT